DVAVTAHRLLALDKVPGRGGFGRRASPAGWPTPPAGGEVAVELLAVRPVDGRLLAAGNPLAVDVRAGEKLLLGKRREPGDRNQRPDHQRRAPPPHVPAHP